MAKRRAALALGVLLVASGVGAGPDAGVGPPAGAKGPVTVVVRSPTAVLQDRSGGATAAPSAPAVHAGGVMGRPIAAATVVGFSSPSSVLSELDREAVDGIARVAAREGCELLVWARAADSSLMAEAQRRAEEIRSRAVAAGLDGARVVTRITARPGAQGVDVVVSALREGSAPSGSRAVPPGPAATALLPGESGKRQIRDALVAVQTSIAACLGEHMLRLRLERADATLSISVSPAGKATGILVGAGDLSGSDVDACLGPAAAAWRLPGNGSGYVVDVPITAIRTGANR